MYLESDAGSKLMQSVAPAKGSPYGRILGSIQSGLILSLGGLALLLMRLQMPAMNAEESWALLFIGGLALALGLGFLLSATATYLLSKSWGLVNGHQESDS